MESRKKYNFTKIMPCFIIMPSPKYTDHTGSVTANRKETAVLKKVRELLLYYIQLLITINNNVTSINNITEMRNGRP